MTDFSQLLNPEQCEAATAGDGPILVLAAAGTGKTRTLVHRVAYLIEQGVPPDRILLLTFTNRAAREMMERAEKVVGPAASYVWAGTFHSICARFLRRYGTFLKYEPGFSIIDEDDQKKIMHELIKSTIPNAKDFPKKEFVLKMISEAANESCDIKKVATRWQLQVPGFVPEQIVELSNKYTARKRELNAMDFDDLLVNGLRLLKECDRIREMFQEHFLYVLVDEYQDTNGLQAEFTDILAGKHRNILAVGDDFQCIYTWRGAQIENILKFPERWDGCKIVKLERNYRSVPGVLSVANAVMKDAPGQFDKKLRPFRSSSGERPWHIDVYDGRSQGNEIMRLIKEAVNLGYRYSDIAVLYRSHYQSMDTQMVLTQGNIPFRITSGIGVFEQAHIKDVLAYLRLLTNPRDELSFMRFFLMLPGVGEASARKLWAKMEEHFDPLSATDVAKMGEILGVKARVKWPGLSRCFELAKSHMADEKIGSLVADFSNYFYEDQLRSNYEENEAEDRLADVKELAVQIAASGQSLVDFLQDVALLTNLDAKKNNDDCDKVILSTVHQAKGMEWPIVLIPWCSEGLFPSSKAGEDGRIDEERRLFYVAVTRAKDLLYLFSPQIRKTADGGFFPIEPSVFIKEIPKDLLQTRKVQSQFSDFNRLGHYSSSNRNYGSSYNSHNRSYGSSRTGSSSSSSKPTYKTTWRR